MTASRTSEGGTLKALRRCRSELEGGEDELAESQEETKRYDRDGREKSRGDFDAYVRG